MNQPPAPRAPRFCRWPAGCNRAIAPHNASGLCAQHRASQVYRERQAAGKCVRCGNDRPPQNPVHCAECFSIAARNMRNSRARALLRAREEEQALAAAREQREQAEREEEERIRQEVRDSIPPVQLVGDTVNNIRTAFQAAELGIPIQLELRDPVAVWLYQTMLEMAAGAADYEYAYQAAVHGQGQPGGDLPFEFYPADVEQLALDAVAEDPVAYADAPPAYEDLEFPGPAAGPAGGSPPPPPSPRW